MALAFGPPNAEPRFRGLRGGGGVGHGVLAARGHFFAAVWLTASACQRSASHERRRGKAASGPAFEVRDLGDKGMGVVAARDIRKGERLLEEQPLLVVSRCRDTRELDSWEEEILAEVAKKPAAQQDAFWGLADDCHTPEAKTAVGICRTNGLPVETAEGEMVGIYATVSRFNHSCNNNVNNSYQDDKNGEVLHAIRDIPQGEELCITYIDLFLTRQERQDTLQRRKKQLRQELLLSNRRRQRLLQLREALPSAVPQGLGTQELIDQDSRNGSGLSVGRLAPAMSGDPEELAGNAAAKTYTYHMGFQLFQHGEEAEECAEKALQQAVLAEGADSWVSSMLSHRIGTKKAQLRACEEWGAIGGGHSSHGQQQQQQHRFLAKEICTPEIPLTATVSDRPTPSRSCRRSSAHARDAAVSPVATELDSDGSDRSRSPKERSPPAPALEPPVPPHRSSDDLLVMLEVGGKAETQAQDPHVLSSAAAAANRAAGLETGGELEDPHVLSSAAAAANRAAGLETGGELEDPHVLSSAAAAANRAAGLETGGELEDPHVLSSAAAATNRAAGLETGGELEAPADRLELAIDIAPAPMTPPVQMECSWITGSVSRPLEQLMFGESPRKVNRGSHIIRELLDTPPDRPEPRPKMPARPVRPKAAPKARVRVPAPVPAQAPAPVPAQVPAPVPAPVLTPVLTPVASRPQMPGAPCSLGAPCALGARGCRAPMASRTPPGRARRAMWFLEQPTANAMHTELSRLANDEEAFLDAALEEALCSLRRRGVLGAGPAAAAQLLADFSAALGASLESLRCVPLDGDLHRMLPPELLGDPRVSAARLPSRRTAKGGSWPGPRCAAQKGW
ncbi:unnamed protein product [Effrenium voratum]|uniref:SET domain-containing protein n=1 Tax=Effrenium voratum TaxID=2562239 RepID=A0AA36HX33_9DINO|nr:unnamed protein product [Effrenium voratum]